MLKVEIKILNPLLLSKIPLPRYTTEGAAGIDVRACIDEPVVITAQETKIIPSGFAINIRDPNIMGVLVPRSGLGIKQGIVLGNLVGIIDSDYQGEIKVGVWNRSQEEVVIYPSDRICQLIFMPIFRVEFDIVTEFSQTTDRGIGGIGHTGVK